MTDCGIVCYYQVDGRWIRKEIKCQCKINPFPFSQCQGTHGHKGVHWCYALDGSLRWSDHDNDPNPNLKLKGCSGFTPPGHKDYLSPADMENHCYRNYFIESVVLDSEVILMLNDGGTPELEASLIRSCSEEEYSAIREKRNGF